MTFLHPGLLYLGSLSALILLLSLFRTRIRRKEVATLSLWEGLPGERGRRAVRIRLLIDPLLVLQILALLALVIALAQPSWRGGSGPRIAILLDTSASMRTRAEGKTSYELAVERASGLLAEEPRAEVAVIGLSSHPVILSGIDRPRGEAMETLFLSSPSFYGDAAREELIRIIAAAGGEDRFDRVVLFSDRAFPDPPPFLETVVVGSGRNREITRFAVRDDPAGGVDAFVRLADHTGEDQQLTLTVSNGRDSVSLPVFLSAGSSADYVVPFPASRRTSFTASIAPPDDFPLDDVRYFSIARPIELSVRWVGPADRYLIAALNATVPIRFVGEGEPADLTVVYDGESPPIKEGDVLLVHAEMPGIVRLGADGEGGDILSLAPDHPLVAGVDPGDLRVWSVPYLDFIASGEVILTAGGRPFLVEFPEEDRSIWFIASSLRDTNLPITVDFPILIRNLLHRLVRLPLPLSFDWALVGEGIPLRQGGEPVDSVLAPDGHPLPLIPGQSAFFPDAPGEYRLITGRGTYPIGVNVPLSESAPPAAVTGDREGTPPAGREGGSLHPIWPLFSGIAAILLAIEWLVYAGVRPARGRNG